MKLDLAPFQCELARAVASIGDHSAWTDLARLGAFAMAIPVRAGGLELGLSAQVVVSTELGAALRPLPGYHDTMLAADLLADVPGPVAAELLSDIAAGLARVATVGIHHDPVGVIDGQDRLHGQSELLPAADWTTVLARTRRSGPHPGSGSGPHPGSGSGPHAGCSSGSHAGPGLGEDVLVVLDPGGCAREPAETLCGSAHRLRFAGASGAVLTLAPDRMSAAIDAARIRQAAFLVGIARAALGAAQRHVTQRQQFGRKLIEFQTVGHRLATLVAEGDGLELLVHEAAWRLDTGRPLVAHAPQALAGCAEFALQATRLAVQLHGARGILAEGLPATGYLLAAVEAVRLGTPAALWQQAGLRRLAQGSQWDDEDAAQVPA